MADIHVFVHPGCMPGDSETQLTKYQRCLAVHGFADVKVVPGGANQRIILMSDTIPSIVCGNTR